MKNIKGSIVPLVTPFNREGKIDIDGLKRLVDFHLRSKTHGISVAGSTGEPGSLSIDEKVQLYKLTSEFLNSKLPLVSGVVTNNVDDALFLAKKAKDHGSDALLVSVPYYTRPNQEGIYGYFSEIASKIDLQIIIYNIPARTGTNIEPTTLAKLHREFSNVIGVKEANKDIDQVSNDIQECGKDFLVYSGIETYCFIVTLLGGSGYFSATSNILPDKLAMMYTYCVEKEFEKARKIHYELLDINKALFLETNPVPVKEALSLMGLTNSYVRKPLCPLSKSVKEELRKVMLKHRLINE